MSKDYTGKKFGRLLAISRFSFNRRGKYTCLCDCGNSIDVTSSALVTGNTKSCGCLQIENRTKHGLSHTPEYNSWNNMIGRCLNKDHYAFPDYGGRGITVCKRWFSFENFYSDMYPRPEKLTLERIDNDKGYSPENCVWDTRKQQSRNKRNNRNIAFNGKSRILIEWAEETGIKSKVISDRLKSGWSIKDALTKKTKKYNVEGNRNVSTT